MNILIAIWRAADLAYPLGVFDCRNDSTGKLCGLRFNEYLVAKGGRDTPFIWLPLVAKKNQRFLSFEASEGDRIIKPLRTLLVRTNIYIMTSGYI